MREAVDPNYNDYSKYVKGDSNWDKYREILRKSYSLSVVRAGEIVSRISRLYEGEHLKDSSNFSNNEPKNK